MNAKYIIADSGGSSTNWGIVLENNEVEFIQTGSLHPKYALTAADTSADLTVPFKGMHVPLYFYGAGCSGEPTQKRMREFLLQSGFSEVHVYPDTLAACRALYGNKPGWLAILGTGSVLIRYDGSQIVQRTGGYGSLVGDEGSGFYFGKLLIRHLLGLEEWEPEWVQLFHSKEFILSELAGPDAQKWISGLGSKTACLDFGFLHRINAELFIKQYCQAVPNLKQLSFTGSYGYEQRDTFFKAFENSGIIVERAMASPLKDLVRFHQMIEY